MHFSCYSATHLLLHTTHISYIKHFVHEWNLMGTIGKTHLFKIQNTLGDWKHTWKHLFTKLITNQPTTNRPQLSHCEHFASMEVGRARRRRRQRGVGHGCRGYARNNISDYIRSTLVDHVINWPDNEGSWAESPPTSKPVHSCIHHKDIQTGKQVCLQLSTPDCIYSIYSTVPYDRQPHARTPLLQAMEEACGDIEVTSIHGWIRHTRRYFPRG